MPVAADQPMATRYPVVRRGAIGEHFIGAYITHEKRVTLKDGEPFLRANGKPRNELVVHALVMPGTTATVGNSEDHTTPAVGDIVRLIIKGRAYSQWIECMNGLKGVQRAGDIIEQTVDSAQKYDDKGAPHGGQITTQAEADKVPRGVTLGFYGPLTLRACTPAEMEWVTKADEAFATIGEGRTVDDDIDDPFT